MEKANDNPTAIEVKQRMKANSRYYAGKMGSLFYVNLRDEKTLVGARCPKCSKVLCPPRSTCGVCFSELTEIVEIGPVGTVESFTQVNYSEAIHPRKAPFIYGVIKLDGADTGIAHFIDGIDANDVKIGMRVKAIFEEDRKGNILDIRGFVPA